jgi:hypothetical protein
MVSTTTGQPAHAIILKPYDHADEYIVFVDDVAEVCDLWLPVAP